MDCKTSLNYLDNGSKKNGFLFWKKTLEIRTSVYAIFYRSFHHRENVYLNVSNFEEN